MPEPDDKQTNPIISDVIVLLSLLTFIGCGIWGLIDLVRFLNTLL